MTVTEDPPGPGHRTRSIGNRVVAVVVLLTSAALALAGLVIFSIQFAALNDRVDDELVQEVRELAQLAEGDPEAGEGAETDLDQLFDRFLRNSLPGTYETMMALIEGTPAYLPGGERPFDINNRAVLAEVESSVRPGLSVIREVDTGQDRLRMIVSSVALEDDPREGTFVVAIDVGAQRRQIWSQVPAYALTSAVAVALAGLAAGVATGRLLRPLRELRTATAGIDARDLTRRVPVTEADPDVAGVAHTFNEVLERLEGTFAGQRQFLDDAAHELRTPLTIIRGNLELTEPDDVDEVRATRELVLDEVDRMQRLVDDLLLLAKTERPDFIRAEPMDVSGFADEVMDRVHLLADRRWSRATEARGELVADRQRLLQAVVQLCANAVKFTGEGDEITVGTTWSAPTAQVAGQVLTPAEAYLVVTVRDSGSGIPVQEQQRIFERFVRADNAGGIEGSGLGLAIVTAIARAHDGAVTLDSLPGEGSTFRIWVPAPDHALQV